MTQQQQQQQTQQQNGKWGFIGRPCLVVAKTIKWIPVLFISCVIGWSYYAYVVQINLNVVKSVTEKCFYLVIYHIVFVVFVWSYLRTILTLPAIVPKSGWKLSPAMQEHLSLAKSEDEWKNLLELFAVEMQVPVLQRSVQDAIRYCEKCKVVKPDRSHHCSVCGDCVLKMDHHCPWVNNCVNFSNYKFFLLFLGYAQLYCLFIAATSARFFIQFWSGSLPDDVGAAKFHIMFLFFVSVMFCISVSSLFWYHIYLVTENRTTLEQFRAPVFRGGNAPDKRGWHLGRLSNFQEVFGEQKLLWFLPVPSALGDGLVYPTRLQDVESSSLAAGAAAASARSLQPYRALSNSTSSVAAAATGAAQALTVAAADTAIVLDGEQVRVISGEAAFPKHFQAALGG